jgi:hypothetical protein
VAQAVVRAGLEFRDDLQQGEVRGKCHRPSFNRSAGLVKAG